MAQKGNTNGFKKGYDAKRYVPQNNGLMEYHNKLSELMRAHSLDAVNFVFETMMNEEAPLKLRMTAANTILDRGLGKPVDRTVIAALDAGATTTDPTKLTDNDLLALVSKSVDKDNILEAEFVEVPETKG